jgi:hypothetical protein
MIHSFSIISPDKNFLYIPIDKNASSRIKKELYSHNWELIEKLSIDPCNYDLFFNSATQFAVLRDPYERWLTGFTTFVEYKDKNFFNVSLYNLLNSKHWYITLQLLFEHHKDFAFDWHTNPQYRLFDNFSHVDSVNFFLYSNDICSKLHQWFRTFNIEIPFNNYYVNQRSDSNLIYHRLISFLDMNANYKEKLINWLQPDYNFFNSVKFVA